jgi:hypothetical protein
LKIATFKCSIVISLLIKSLIILKKIIPPNIQYILPISKCDFFCNYHLVSLGFLICLDVVSIETWKFCHFLTVLLNLDREVSGFLHISCQDFSICQDFLSFSYSKCQEFLTNLENLELSLQSWGSRQKSWQDKVLTEKS